MALGLAGNDKSGCGVDTFLVNRILLSQAFLAVQNPCQTIAPT